MDKIKVSYDYRSLSEKPNETLAASISKNIGGSPKLLSWNGIKEFALDVSLDGHTFCPATFKNGKRSKDNFEQQQLFALDFDNKDANRSITFDEVKKRAEHYELPMLFAYETLSSTNRDKFRIVFLNDTSVTDRKIAEAMQLALGTIFPEADSSCYKDTSKMYYGGKSVLYRSDDTPTINIESLFRNHAIYLKDKYKANHYKERLAKFAEETGIALTPNGLLDISVTDNPTEPLGASQTDDNGKNSPSPIIYSSNFPNIKANGEIFPNRYYCIRFADCTGKASVTTSVDKTDVVVKQYKNHQEYRSIVLEEMECKCQLFNEFRTGKRDMSHNELFGLATNLIAVETGYQKFKDIQSDYPTLYDAERCQKWESILSYIKQQSYKPMQCNNFCPYKKQCNHSTNILSTVHPKRVIMEKLPDYHEEFYSIEEVQEDTYSAIYNAYRSSDNGVHIIKSMTGAGKSHSYLRLMAENPDDRFLIAAPTNLLKNEIYRKAEKMGIDAAKTPSLDEIKDEIPPNVWNRINRLYKSGQHKAVHPYIREVAVKKNISCLIKYCDERERLKKFGGSLITTHRYLLNMDEKRLREYDAVIIDEDIIFKSVISNQCEITISDLEKLFTETTNVQLSKKIKKLLKFAKTQTCIELDSFGTEEDDDDNDADDISITFDVPSFCMAKKFFVRKTENEPNLKENTVVFLRSADFKKVKYIIVSATVDETICNKYFGEDNVNFYECKKARYKGTLSQYPSKSMSRSSIANNPGIIRRLMKHFEFCDDRVITFMKENIGKLHFGNTEGSNTLEGKDILVAGTPYHAEFLYKLVAFFMKCDFDEDEKMTAQIVEHNGYRFRFTTFENESLRSIHFWMIESELEQAVGRARLLRNECTVNLFSNFPLSQAEMVRDFDYDDPSKPAKSTI